MNKISYVLIGGGLALACSAGVPDNAEVVASSNEHLDVAKVSYLTKMQGTQTSTDEQVREDDTANSSTAYYKTQRVFTRSVETGALGDFPATTLSTLNKFQRWYGFSTTSTPAAGEATATYYNRGDLGIGREMHCIDKYDSVGAIACYVRNFAAGDDGSEFTFGGSADIAFTNANNNHAFATVAMVFQPGSLPRMMFMVYDGTGSKLLPAAALDRAGLAYQNVFNLPPSAARTAKLATLGVPGVNFNNHIPSNCITCHGGEPYHRADGTFDNGNQFLPFDLDNFDYDLTHTRLGQERSFRDLNQIVRRVASLNKKTDFSPADVNHSIQYQIDGWYNNPNHADSLPSCGANQACFNSNYVPTAWDNAPTLYKEVVRGGCRNCHIANNHNATLTFDTEQSFRNFVGGSVGDITSFTMPHALQSTRQFWQSRAPATLETYVRQVLPQSPSVANNLHNANGGDVVTVDPQVLSTISFQ